MQFKLVKNFFWISLFFFLNSLGQAQEIEMISIGPYPAWSSQSVAFEIRNTTTAPLAILGYSVIQGEKTVYQNSFLSTYQGQVRENKLILPLKVILDEPGAEARLPHPPITKQLGEVRFMGAEVVFPGESYSCFFPILATYDWRENFTLKVQWISPEKELIYKWSRFEDKTIRHESDPMLHRSRKYEEFWEISYDLLQNAPEQVLSPLDFPLTAPQFIPPRFLLLQQTVEGLSASEKQISFSCTVLAPEFDRDQAFLDVQVDASQALHSWAQMEEIENKLQYFVPGEVWWYVKTLSEEEASTMKTSRSTTYLYGKKVQIVLQGDWSSALQRANQKGAEEIEIFEMEESFQEEASRQQEIHHFANKCKTMGLEVQKHELKGGGTQTRIHVPGNRLVAFLLEWTAFKH